jgi:hypothetical protein
LAKRFRVFVGKRPNPGKRSETLTLDIVTEGGKTLHAVLHALGTALLLLLALGHDGGTEASAEVFGQLVELGVAVDLDGLLGGVADDVAVVAPGKMVLQLNFGFLVEDAV